MTKKELIKFLIEECEYTESEVNKMSKYRMVDAILSYDGFIGYTDDILDLIEAVYNVKLKE